MTLRSADPFWLARNGILASYPLLKEDERCDVVIVGGGITGALIAHELTAAGVDAVMIEKGAVASASTAASTAMLLYEPDTELRGLIARVGEQHAVRVYQLGLEAIDAIEALTVDLDDACDFARHDTWYVARKWWNTVRLKREFWVRQRAGLRVEWLGKADIAKQSTLANPAAIVSHGNAAIDPVRFAHRLIARAAVRGMRVYERTEMTHFDDHGDHMVLHTVSGARVVANRIVFATGYDSAQYIGREPGTLHSTYALCSEPVAAFTGWPDRAMIWESSRPYFYLRTTHDQRVMVGGGDISSANSKRRDGKLAEKTESLRQQFQLMFPAISLEVAYAWAGTFGESEDGLPFIGLCSRCPNAYFALGYGGNGITFGMIAARLITDAHLGRRNVDAPIFAFDR